ncbi:hypothetical protein BC835DRAFT_1411771 [Cytidiella melzeri]|nr:hypothetical protein BC835DRAFT_1411771 [Cytidiella melzeri]
MRFSTSLILLASIITGSFHTSIASAIPYGSIQPSSGLDKPNNHVKRQCPNTDDSLCLHTTSLIKRVGFRFRKPWTTKPGVGYAINWFKDMEDAEYQGLWGKVMKEKNKGAKLEDLHEWNDKLMWLIIDHAQKMIRPGTKEAKDLENGLAFRLTPKPNAIIRVFKTKPKSQ